MTLSRRTFCVCNRCGAYTECKSVAPIINKSEVTAAGWMVLDEQRHLCPSCAAAYKAKQEECDRVLAEFRGEAAPQ